MSTDVERFQQAVAHYQRGDLDAAESAAKTLLMNQVSLPGLRLLLARIATDRHQSADALALLSDQVQQFPQHPAGWRFLGVLTFQVGDAQRAAQCFKQLTTLQPQNAGDWLNLGKAWRVAAEPQQAVAALTRAHHLAPESIETCFHLGELAFQLGDAERAHSLAQQIIDQQPNHAAAWSLRGISESALGRTLPALLSLQQAERLAPNEPAYAIQRGWLALGHGEMDLADTCFQRALSLQPGNTEAQIGQATLAERLGDLAASRQQLEAIHTQLGHHPRSMTYAVCLAQVAAKSPTGLPARTVLEDVLAHSQSRSDQVRGFHSLGDLLNQQGEWDAAFDAHQRANELARSGFDLAGTVAHIESSIETPAMDSSLPNSGLVDARPIFVVGMPRSGTTLVETILGRHQAVYPAGELQQIEWLAVSLTEQRHWWQALNARLATAATETLSKLGQQYLDHIAKLDAGQALRVVDKNPMNFLHLGFIARILPQARVIYCKRDPLDTCLSCYFQNFRPSLSFANSLTDLATLYEAHEQLMAHWMRTLPVPIHPVQYEDLVTDPEANIRTLLDFCGLEWDEQCLSPEQSSAYRNTASYAQVRQAIHTRSIGRWKHYRTHLEPLISRLNLSEPE